MSKYQQLFFRPKENWFFITFWNLQTLFLEIFYLLDSFWDVYLLFLRKFQVKSVEIVQKERFKDQNIWRPTKVEVKLVHSSIDSSLPGLLNTSDHWSENTDIELHLFRSVCLWRAWFLKRQFRNLQGKRFFRRLFEELSI